MRLSSYYKSSLGAGSVDFYIRLIDYTTLDSIPNVRMRYLYRLLIHIKGSYDSY